MNRGKKVKIFIDTILIFAPRNEVQRRQTRNPFT